MAVISFASTGEFSAANTSSILSSVVRWLLPGISDKQLALIHLLTRKLGHFTEFAILGFFTARAFSTSSRNFLRRAWFRWGVLLVVIYAFLDEYHQSFVPSRTPSVYDSLIDITGGLTVLLAFVFWQKRKSSSVSR
jgi:VanZ family protein